MKLQSLSLLLPLLAAPVLSNPTVTIDSGVIIGTTTALPDATAPVNKFLGVPFAAKPLGQKRFALPQLPPQWRVPLKTQAWSPACVQQFNYPEATRNFTMAVFNNPPPAESEDCLYLNVYAPSTPGKGRAVMFWIYGGSLQFGNAGQIYYDGSSFAAYQDVVIVTVNYRTNVFGFPNSPELPKIGQNLGFYDQRAGLDWVRGNIKQFGGDPKKVTIFGESAGAVSVDALVTSFAHNPPFHAAIMQSGQISVRNPPTNSTANWVKLVTALGCPTGAGALSCMRSKDASAIESVVSHQALTFSPIADGVTLVPSPEAHRVAHQIANVPVLIGNDAQEGRVFVVGDTNITAFLELTFPNNTALQQSILAAYPIKPGQTAYDVIAEIDTDYAFICGTSLYAAISASSGYPTWRYHFAAAFPNTQGFPGAGIYHSSEIPIVFGTYPSAGVTAQEFALSQSMQHAWAQFAKEPMRGPGWNRLGTFGGLDLGVFGKDGSAGVSVVGQGVVDGKCGLYSAIYERWIGGIKP